MELGPVPESGYQLVERLLEPAEVDDDARRRARERLTVYPGVMRRYLYPVLRTRRAPDLDVFSESEVEALTAVVHEFGQRRVRDLVDLTHEHRGYQRADAGRAPSSRVPLPYEYFFDDAPEHLRCVQALAEESQEDRDLAADLRRAGQTACRPAATMA
jgi:hypothetical protein